MRVYPQPEESHNHDPLGLEMVEVEVVAQMPHVMFVGLAYFAALLPHTMTYIEHSEQQGGP